MIDTHFKCFYISWVVSNNPTCIDCWWYFRSSCFNIALLPAHGRSYESITTLHLPELVKEQFIWLNTSSQCSLLIDTWLLLICTLILSHLAFSKHGVFNTVHCSIAQWTCACTESSFTQINFCPFSTYKLYVCSPFIKDSLSNISRNLPLSSYCTLFNCAMCTVKFTQTTFRILGTCNVNVTWHVVNYWDS